MSSEEKVCVPKFVAAIAAPGVGVGNCLVASSKLRVLKIVLNLVFKFWLLWLLNLNRGQWGWQEGSLKLDLGFLLSVDDTCCTFLDHQLSSDGRVNNIR